MPATATATKFTAVALAKFVRASEITGLDLTHGALNLDPEVMPQLVKFGASDCRLALRKGEITISQTRLGNVDVTRVTDKTVTISYKRGMWDAQNTEIATGTVAEMAPIIAGLFDVKP